MTPEELRDKLRVAIEDSKTLMFEAGYQDFMSLAIDPNDKQGAMKVLIDVLREKHRHGLVIGGGLRKLPQMIPILVEIINTTKDVSPKTQILFVDWPTGIVDSVKRLKQQTGPP